MKRNTIISIYHELNRDCFNGLLTMPAIRASRSEGERGSYLEAHKKARAIMFYNPRNSYLMARTIVYHEMVHQFLAEIMQITEDNHHGAIFWETYVQFAPKYGKAFLWI